MNPEIKAVHADTRVVAAALALLAVGGVALAQAYGARHAALFLTGGGLGVALYHALFGFTSAWRAFLTEGRGAGLRAQMVMLALATIIFLPVIAGGTLFGRPVGGAIAPAGVSVLVGAFLFGIGMQFGGGCASGTLFTVGGGSVRMVVTLAAFIAGSLISTLHAPFWYALPSLGSVSITASFGTGPALVLQLCAFAAIWWASALFERRRFGSLAAGIEFPTGAEIARRALRGPWPLVWGAVALALLNVLTLALAGHPWSITFAFGLWGAKIAALGGIDVAAWEFWTWPAPARALGRSVFADVTSVMNFGIIGGALLAAGLAGKFRPSLSIPPRALVAEILGGLLLGYGARLAFGCNIGAFFSGVASGSLHGWLWFAAALAGNYAGLRLRPLFAPASAGKG